MVALNPDYAPVKSASRSDIARQRVDGTSQMCPKDGLKRVPGIGQFEPQNRVGDFFARNGDRVGTQRPVSRIVIGEKYDVASTMASGHSNFEYGAVTGIFSRAFNKKLTESHPNFDREDRLVIRRNYTVDFEGSTYTAEQLMQMFVDDPNQFTKTFNPLLKTKFLGPLTADTTVQIDGPGLVDPSVYVLASSSPSFGSVTLATVDGHPEVGYINFSAYSSGDVTTFSITSVASARTRFHESAHIVGGQHAQKAIWTNVLNNVVRHAGGSASRITYNTGVQGDGY